MAHAQSDADTESVARSTPRIINGTDIATGQYPFLAGIEFLPQGGNPATDYSVGCGGSLIDAVWVVSAAHCFDGETPASVRIGLGSADKTNFSQTIQAAEIIQHPNWIPTGMTSDDIALVRLAQPADLNDPNVALIPYNFDPAFPAVGSTVITMGWGDTTALEAQTMFPDIAREVDLDVLLCDGTVSGSEFQNVCAFDAANNQDSCGGDSGGPLVQDIGGALTLVATVEAGPADGTCGINPYGIYQRVARHDLWILRTIAGGPTPTGYTALNPARILDSRPGALNVGPFATPWGAETRTFQVTGMGGVPADNVTAVALNVTSVSPSADFSWLTITPTGSPAATTAQHNFGKSPLTTELSNDLIIAAVGPNGRIDIANASGTVDIVIDVVGYYSTVGFGYNPLAPARILDSRPGALNVGAFATPWDMGETRAVSVVDGGGVPAAGVDSVVLNVTSVNATANFSWLTVSPTGAPASTTAAHNFGKAAFSTELVNDLVVAKVGVGGTIDIRNEAGTVDLVIDVVGYYDDTPASGYIELNPSRILDSRPGATNAGAYMTPWPAGGTRTVTTGFGDCATAVVLHVTTVNPTAGLSWLTVTPTGTAPSTTAAHNFGTAAFTSQLANDIVIARTGTGGSIDIRNEAGTVDLVIDIVGYFGDCTVR